jgi:PAS domain S-box-containing protein
MTDPAAARQITTLVEANNSEQIFRRLVNSISDYAIFMLTPEGNIASWNEGARQIKGYSPKEIIGKHFRIFYTEKEQQKRKPERELEEALAVGHYKEEGWRIRKDGTRFWASVLITPVRDEEGTLLGSARSHVI